MKMNQSTIKKSVLLSAVSSSILGAVTFTGAQATTLEEITVTAQKREQSLQEVPISVSVISGAEISNQDITTALELSTTVPGFIATKDGASDNISIRGVSSGGNGGFEQSAATFVDGVYRGRSRQIRTGFLDIGQVEVLKGPQSTFFGNNAIAGALNITTARPTDEFEGYVTVQYEPDWQEALVTGAVSGPLSDVLKGRVAFSRRDTEEGFGKVLDENGAEVYNGPLVDETLARVSLTWEPTDDFTAFLRLDYSKSEIPLDRVQEIFDCPPSGTDAATAGGGCGQVLRDFGPAVAGTAGLDYRVASPAAFGAGTELDTSEALINLSYNMDEHSITSVTAYSEYETQNRVAVGQTPNFFLGIGSDETFEQFSQEIRIASDSEGPVNYMAGVYYQKDSLYNSPEFNFQFLNFVAAMFPELAPLAPVGYRVEYDQDTEVFSSFASLDWNVSEKLLLSFGLRYTEVEKDFANRNTHATFPTNGLGGATPFSDDVVLGPGALGFLNSLAVAGDTTASRSDDDILYSISASYQFNEDLLLYAKYSKGFKAGGFDFTDRSLNAAERSYDPEEANAYEAGFKSTLADGSATVNVAIFHTDYKDLQETSWLVLDNGSFQQTVANAAEMTSQGVEVEIDWAVTEQLRTKLSFAYVDAEYDSFPNATCTTAQQLAFVPSTPGETCTQDLSGAPRPFNAELSGNLSFDYQVPLTEYLQLNSHISFFYADGFSVSGAREPGLNQNSYTKVSARISLGDVDDTWDISLIGKNLTDEKVLVWGAANPDGSHAGQLEAPSYVAVNASYRW